MIDEATVAQRTLSSLIEEHGITIESVHCGIQVRQRKGEKPWEHDLWHVTLSMGNRSMSTSYHTGLGLRKPKPWGIYKRNEQVPSYHLKTEAVPVPPTAHDVLQSLIMDVSGWFNAADFEDWASDYGYDPDSRAAEKIYDEISETAKLLLPLLSDAPEITRVAYGRGGFAKVYDTDRLRQFLECDTDE